MQPPGPKYMWESRVLTLVGGAILYQFFIGIADSNYRKLSTGTGTDGDRAILACHFSDTMTSQPFVVCSDEQFKALPNRSDPSLAS